MIISFYFILFIAASFLLIVGNEAIKRKFLLPVYVTRKCAHMGGALIAFLSPLFLTQIEVIGLCTLFALVLLSARKTTFFSSIHAVNRQTLGEVFLPVGVILAALFFLPQDLRAFQFGVLVLGICDAFAGLIGEGFGKHRRALFNSKKTLEGALAFLTTSIILTFIFFPHIDYRVLGIPLILTTVEFSLGFGLDNLVLPLLAGYLIRFL